MSARTDPSTDERLTFPDHPPMAIAIGIVLAIAIGLPGILDRRDAGTITAACVAVIAIVLASLALAQRTTLAHDAMRGTLRITRVRPPFRALEREVALTAVAEVNVETPRRHPCVVLRLGTGERLPLPGVLPASLPAHELAETIRGWVRDAVART